MRTVYFTQRAFEPEISLLSGVLRPSQNQMYTIPPSATTETRHPSSAMPPRTLSPWLQHRFRPYMTRKAAAPSHSMRRNISDIISRSTCRRQAKGILMAKAETDARVPRSQTALARLGSSFAEFEVDRSPLSPMVAATANKTWSGGSKSRQRLTKLPDPKPPSWPARKA